MCACILRSSACAHIMSSCVVYVSMALPSSRPVSGYAFPRRLGFRSFALVVSHSCSCFMPILSPCLVLRLVLPYSIRRSDHSFPLTTICMRSINIYRRNRRESNIVRATAPKPTKFLCTPYSSIISKNVSAFPFFRSNRTEPMGFS